VGAQTKFSDLQLDMRFERDTKVQGCILNHAVYNLSVSSVSPTKVAVLKGERLSGAGYNPAFAKYVS
ncbi:MAG: hypothetical protein WCJ25_05085, partial [Candidatus Moraniibacteriota bacterium]